ncbi:MAG: hypothetical protein DRP74_09130 [Candidatus Omnitrophota bacterium]|nr:MAG: hypothetical protein DRP74_09130 [Candidatus Omnitrophota bacterium]
MGGIVPSPYPDTFMMGVVTEYFIDGAGRYGPAGQEVNTITHWMRNGGGSNNWDMAYRYLTGGFTYGWYGGWNGSQNGAGWINYLNLAANGNPSYLPVGIYYQIAHVSSRTNNSEMGKYYQDWTRLMTLCNTWLTDNPTKCITIDVEPDFAGYVQQGTYSSNISVGSATGTGFPNLSGFADNFFGYSKALLYIKDQVVSPQNLDRLIIAFHVSGWAQSPNPASQSGMSDAELQTHANAIANFIAQCQPSSGSKYDIFFTDPSGYDGEGPNGAPYDWDINGEMATQYAKWLNYLSEAANLRGFLWQVPMGNSRLNNVPGHYRDKRPEYFLANTSDGPNNGDNGAHICQYVNSGVIGILFGRGGPPDGVAGTGVMDMYYPPGDGYNTVNQDGTAGVTNHWVSNTIDDDGGFLRSRIVNKTNWANLCPIKGPTETFTPTYTFTHTLTETFTNTYTPTNTQTYTLIPTSTFTSTNTYTITNSYTPTHTLTNTYTLTFTYTFTETPTLTSTQTLTFTQTYSFTFTSTNTPMSTDTYTVTQSPTDTETDTPTYTFTFTVTPTRTPTFTVTNTQTFTFTYTFTETHIGTSTLTYTFTETQSFTPTDTETSTETYTETSTPTDTLTFTSTFTPTDIYTDTETYTETETQTPIDTGTPTNTPTGTYFTETPTDTGTPTDTSTYTYTFTSTTTNTFTYTQTYTQTYTSTETPTGTQPPSFTPTDTLTGTETMTPTETYTGIQTPTFTPTDTYTFTQTNTQTYTPTNTLTFTRTNTLTNTYTFTPTNTATNTWTDTLTNTPTYTWTYTATFTRTNTPTNTYTPTSTYTGTITETPTPTEEVEQEIEDVVIYPNPNNPVTDPIKIRFKITKEGEYIIFRLYTAAARLIKEIKLTKGFADRLLKQGINEIEIPNKYFRNLAKGTYYYLLIIEDKDGIETRAKIDKLIILK